MLERDLFIAAFDIDDAIERRAYLDSVCTNNAALRNRLERLLSHAREDSDFLDQPAADLCSDWDSAWLAESNGVSPAEDEPVTQIGAGDDTGQTVLLISAVPSAATSSTEVLSASQLGTLFGRYRVERVLGAGGMGIVYLAEDLRLGRRVALKIPKFDEDGKLHLVERFRREARTMGLVQHRHLCPIFDVAEQDGQHYLTMAFIDGETLGQAIKRGATFSTQQIAELVRKLALALDTAHRAGVVHRDLKPANVMIDREGEPIVMDFGLAWMVHETDARMTQSGAIIGTPAYMSPEQAEGEPDKIGAASDIYSLGAMLYELLAGRPVYTGSVTNVLYKLKHETPTRPSVIRRGVDPQLEAICWKAIARRPEDRFATAGEFAEALAGCWEGEAPAEPRVSRPLTPALSPTATSAPKATPLVGEREQNPKPPRRWRTALAGFAALVLFAAILVITTRNGTVEVTSPDGKLPSDVKVVVTRDGEEIELLQADNQWSAKLVNGEYQVQLRGGEDRFEITTSQLTINRLGSAVVKLEMRPPVAVVKPQPNPVVAAPAIPVTPPQPPTEPAKPAVSLNIDDQPAKALQAACAKEYGVPVEYTNSIGMKFVLIPPGEFMMGSTPTEIAAQNQEIDANSQWRERIQSETPQHKVVLTRPIYLGVHEVTQKEYETIKETNPAHFSPNGAGQAAVAKFDTQNHPVEKVSWNQAVDFCAKLNATENVKPYSIRLGKVVIPLIGDGYGLPTEALWEYACRAGSPTKFWMGDVDTDLSRVGWFDGNSGTQTHAVGGFPANPFGLHDLHGNVWEWVQDVWEPKYYERFSESPAINPLALPSDIPDFPDIPETPRRVVRGGSFGDPAWFCRSSCRHAFDPAQRYLALGFRVSLTMDVVKAAIAKRTPPPVEAPRSAITPFDAKQAKAHQAAWAEHLGVPVEYKNSIGMQFTLIPPGEFTMGSTPDEIAEAVAAFSTSEDQTWPDFFRSEAPQHPVRQTKPFYLGVNEVTQGEYEQVLGKERNSSCFAPQGFGKDQVVGMDTSRHPVEMVNWNDAAEFSAKLSEKEQLQPFYLREGEVMTPLEGTGYRLPTEAQWEFACRAGTVTKYWAGTTDQDLARAGWFNANSEGRTHAVGELAPNPFGLYDMHGNVEEWCQDHFAAYPDQLVENPSVTSTTETRRVTRGGHWVFMWPLCRSSHRFARTPESQFNYTGFRVVLEVEAVKAALKERTP